MGQASVTPPSKFQVTAKLKPPRFKHKSGGGAVHASPTQLYISN